MDTRDATISKLEEEIYMPKDLASVLSIISLTERIDFSLEINLIRNGKLVFERLGGRNGTTAYFTGNAVADQFMGADETTHWYRSMSKHEFDQLFIFRMIVPCDKNAYTGIAPNRKYVKDEHFSNEGNATHIVEFGPRFNLSDSDSDGNFSIYKQLRDRGLSIKAEGGGTFGLGPQGSPTVQNHLKAQESTIELFTEWLRTGKIYRKLVGLRLKAKMNAKDTIDAKDPVGQ